MLFDVKMYRFVYLVFIYIVSNKNILSLKFTIYIFRLTHYKNKEL